MQFLAAGIVPAAVAALRANEHAGDDVVVPLAGAIELLARAYAVAWVKADGVTALVAALREQAAASAATLALCRVVLVIAHSAWLHPGWRRRFRAAGVVATMEGIRDAPGADVAAREVAGSVLFELAGGCW